MSIRNNRTGTNLTLAVAANATKDYSVVMEGDALAPRLSQGQLLWIRPAVNADPAAMAAGSLIVAIAAPDPAQPRRFSRPTLFVRNADGDLLGGDGTIAAAGTYIVLGIARDTSKTQHPEEKGPSDGSERSYGSSGEEKPRFIAGGRKAGRYP